MLNELINLEYACKSCGKPVDFSTNPIDSGSWMLGAPAMLCLTGLNEEAKRMVDELKCHKCLKI